MNKKILIPTLNAVQQFNATKTLKIQIKHYLLNNQMVAIRKDDAGFIMQIDFTPSEGFSSAQLHRIDQVEAELIGENEHYYLPEPSLLLQQSFPDWNSDNQSIPIHGSISQISTKREDEIRGKFLRLLIPAGKHRSHLNSMRNIRGWGVNIDEHRSTSLFTQVRIQDHVYHFWVATTDDNSYLIIDSISPIDVDKFTSTTQSIILGFGFLFGNLILDEGYILSSTTDSFEVIEDLGYRKYRDSILSGYGVITTNAYSAIDMTAKNKQEHEERLEYVKPWINRLVEFEETHFSSLCQLFYENEPISRAAMVTLQGNSLAFELKGSAYSIALEAITQQVLDRFDAKVPKPILKLLFKELKNRFLHALDELVPAQPENFESKKNFCR